LLRPILRTTGSAEHAAASTSHEAIAPSHRAARGQQRSPHEITEDRRPGCCGLACRGHRGGARV